MWKKKHTVRVVYGVVLLFASVLMPWWIVVAIGVAGAFMFDQFYEAIIAGLLIDLMFYTNGSGFFVIPVVFTLGGFVLYAMSEFLSKYLRLYE